MMKKIVSLLLGLVTIGCVLLISVYLIVSGLPAIREIGPIEFLFGTQWSSTSADPRFGILPFILISIYGTAGAMVIGVPVGFLNAVYAAKPASARVKRLLTVKPEVLLMDESTSALDPISTQRIEELAVSLRRRYTIVIVTHNMQQACRISTRTAFFLMGRLVEYGDTRQLFENPVQKETEDYVDGRFG
mgnify:FL=1